MKRYVVEIVTKVVYKIECSALSPECAERFARTMYDCGALEGEGEVDSVTFETEEKKGE